MKSEPKELSGMELLEELGIITDKLKILCNLMIMYVECGKRRECQTMAYILLDYIMTGREKVLCMLENKSL